MEHIKNYSNEYFDACMDLYDSNQSIYFGPDERKDYINFLNSNVENNNYLVCFNDSKLVAAGGYGDVNGKIHLRWGMVDNRLHKSGLGTKLLLIRLQHIKDNLGYVSIYIQTSRQAAGFFEKHGFEILKVIPNYYGVGFDQVTMHLPAN